MQGIYKIENLINGKCYVGQSVNIKARWAEHKFDANRKNRKTYTYPLYSAIRKYGKKAFKFSILELVTYKDDLTSRETHWYYKLKPEYNQVIPQFITSTSLQSKEVYKIEIETLNILDRYDSIQEASRQSNTSAGNITMACKGQRPRASGYYWCYADEYRTWQPNDTRLKKVSVVKIDRQTNEQLHEYISITEAAEQNNVFITNIWRCCNHKAITTGGYKWAYKT